MTYNIYDQADVGLLNWIRKSSTLIDIGEDAPIIYEGSLAEGLFIVEKGSLLIETTKADGTLFALAEQGVGSLVGEMSWLEHRPAVARVTAKAGSKILQLKQEVLNVLKNDSHPAAAPLYRTIGTKLSLQIQGQNAWIHRFPEVEQEPLRKVLVLFAELDEQDVGWIRQIGRLHRLRGGEVLLDQGQPVTTVYLVLAGEARILIHDGDSLRVVGTSRRGELLGEMTLLNAANKGASARVDTSEGLDLLALDINDLLAELSHHSARAARFWRALARMLSQRSRDQLMGRGLAASSRRAESDLDSGEIDVTQLSSITTAGSRFDWLCRQFQSEGD